MKTNHFATVASVTLIWLFVSCGFDKQGSQQSTTTTPAAAEQPAGGGQASVQDDESQKDIVKVAVGSADHSTLVAALQAAGLVDALANAGPFTVFAPTNDAFAKLPAGTVDNLLKPENLDQLKNVLQFHVTPGVYRAESLKNGQKIGMVNAQNAVIAKKDGTFQINESNIVGSVRATNGIIHVIDAVMIPQ